MLYVAMFDEVDEGTAIFNAQTSLRRATVYSSQLTTDCPVIFT